MFEWKHEFLEYAKGKYNETQDNIDRVIRMETDIGGSILDLTPSKLDEEIRYVAYEKVKMQDPGKRRDYAISLANTIYNYNMWCRSRKFRYSNRIKESKYVSIATASLWAIKSPEHLQGILDDGLSPEYLRTVDCVVRGFVWLIFSGLTKEEAFEADSKDVVVDSGFKSGYIKVIRDGEQINVKLYRQSLICLSFLSTSDYFKMYNNRYREGYANTRRTEGTRLLRGGIPTEKSFTLEQRKKADPSYTQYSQSILKRWKQNATTNRELSYESVSRSGEFYRIYSLRHNNSDWERAFDKYIDRLCDISMESNKRTVKIKTRIDDSGNIIEEESRKELRRFWKRKIKRMYTAWIEVL